MAFCNPACTAWCPRRAVCSRAAAGVCSPAWAAAGSRPQAGAGSPPAAVGNPWTAAVGCPVWRPAALSLLTCNYQRIRGTSMRIPTPVIVSSGAAGSPGQSPNYSSLKLKPSHLDLPLVAGCSIDHPPCLLHVSGRDMDQSYKLYVKYIYLKDGFVCSSVSFCSKYKIVMVTAEIDLWLVEGMISWSNEVRSPTWQPPCVGFSSLWFASDTEPRETLFIAWSRGKRQWHCGFWTPALLGKIFNRSQ